MLGIEFIARRRPASKIGQLVRAPDHVFFIEDAFTQAPEKSRQAILENIAPRTQQRGSWIKVAAQRDQVIFVSASSVQQQESPRGRACRRWNKTMSEVETAHRLNYVVMRPRLSVRR